MSSVIVQVCKIDEVKPHTNADALEICLVKGWNCIVKKGEYKAGDLVVYFPPDTVLSQEWTDKFGVTAYCSKCDQGMRIKQAKLRGEPSFGLLVRCPDDTWEVGKDVAEFYGAEKYIAPTLGKQGDIMGKSHPLLEKFTDIENMRNFPDILQEGEEVICTEKLDGTQVRMASIQDDAQGQIIICASKNHPRKRPENEQEMRDNWYWFPYTIPGVKKILDELGSQYKVVEIFGETYGRVQKLVYGMKGLAFRAFGLIIDGKYVDYDERVALFTKYEVPMVPLLYRGPFSLAKIKEISEGRSTVPGADNIREGTVVQPVIERRDPKIGRVLLKFVSDTYLGKHGDAAPTDA